MTTRLRVTLRLLEPLLGTVPHDPEVYRTFIGSKAPAAAGGDAEAETVAAREERGWTGFHKDARGLFLYDYQVKGMLKELARIAYPKDNAAALKAVVAKFESFVYVRPRQIRFGVAAVDTVIERPLRAQTMQGPRVTVVRSDALGAGRTIAFELHLLPGPITEAHVRAVLALGEYRGIGQWRSGGYGRFAATIESSARTRPRSGTTRRTGKA